MPNPKSKIQNPKSGVLAALDRLRAVFSSMDRVFVAFSGGVDSTLVLAVAVEQLGDRATACLGVSPSYPQREKSAAIALAQQLGAKYRLIETTEHLDPRYQANAGDRCFWCKSDLYDKLTALAAAESATVVDGSHAGDVGDDRPGMTAGKQRGVRSPLIEAGIDKPLIRAIARHLQLAVSDKPAMACLSSRIPVGTQVTEELLRRIEQAEDLLVELGFTQFRVRHHDQIARLELPEADLPRTIEHRDQIVSRLRQLGWKHVTLDLAGFRRESDEPLIALGSARRRM